MSAVDAVNATLQNDVSLRLFVFDSEEGPNELELGLIHDIVENWWLQNSGVVTGLKKWKSPGKQSMDDNGDDLDSLTQDYYNFYAASAFSRGFGDADLTSLDSIKLFFFANSSRAVMLLIGFFVLISLGLVSLITYKYIKTSGAISGRKKRQKSGGSSMVITSKSSFSATLAGSDRSIKIGNKQDIPDSQSTKEFSSSPNLNRNSACFSSINKIQANQESNLVNYTQNKPIIHKSNLSLNNSINNNSLATSDQVENLFIFERAWIPYSQFLITRKSGYYSL